MFTQHAVFVEPVDDDEIEKEEDQNEIESNTQETDDKDSDAPAHAWTVPPASTFLCFYSDEPEYLQTKSASEVNTSAAGPTSPESSLSLLTVLPTDSLTNQPAQSLPPSRSLTEEGSSSVTPPELETPVPQWGQYRQEKPSISLWEASPTPTQRTNYLSRSCSICEKQMVTLNPFKTLTCHDCMRWVQESLELCSNNEATNHNEGKDDEEEFKFMGIPIAGENEGDSEES
jgi:hypothetical protein